MVQVTFFKVVGTGDTNQLGYQVDTGGGLVEFNIGSLNAIYTLYDCFYKI